MKTYDIASLNEAELDDLCRRKAIDIDGAADAAKTILQKVRSQGDKALIDLARQFDGAQLSSLKVSETQIKQAKDRIPKQLKDAFEQAFSNIEKFHKAQATGPVKVETMPGVVCYAETRPIEKVGLYVPGGTASLPSTVLMLGIPAMLAGCPEIVLCTPPRKDGSIADSIIYAADLCRISKIFKAGGAQAVGAMAYGTETIPKTYKIFGPGNQYVTAAKMLVSIDAGGAAIDMPAGPSEVMVIADKSSRADFAAADLLSQAEHGSDSMGVLVCTDEAKAREVTAEIKKQLDRLPRRALATEALKNSYVLIAGSMDEAIGFANRFAPEHLILGFDDAATWTGRVTSAGSVFIGPYSSESAGDYASGTNHSLPTYGYARAYSGVSVASFQKRITFQEVTKEGAANIAPTVTALATEEELEAHKRAMEIRL